MINNYGNIIVLLHEVLTTYLNIHRDLTYCKTFTLAQVKTIHKVGLYQGFLSILPHVVLPPSSFEEMEGGIV
jgi:hypothetical protein